MLVSGNPKTQKSFKYQNLTPLRTEIDFSDSREEESGAWQQCRRLGGHGCHEHGFSIGGPGVPLFGQCCLMWGVRGRRLLQFLELFCLSLPGTILSPRTMASDRASGSVIHRTGQQHANDRAYPKEQFCSTRAALAARPPACQHAPQSAWPQGACGCQLGVKRGALPVCPAAGPGGAAPLPAAAGMSQQGRASTQSYLPHESPVALRSLPEFMMAEAMRIMDIFICAKVGIKSVKHLQSELAHNLSAGSAPSSLQLRSVPCWCCAGVVPRAGAAPQDL